MLRAIFDFEVSHRTSDSAACFVKTSALVLLCLLKNKIYVTVLGVLAMSFGECLFVKTDVADYAYMSVPGDSEAAHSSKIEIV